MFGPNDSAAGAGPGPGGRGRDRLHRSVQCQGNRQDEGEDQEALWHCAQQAPGPTEHNGTAFSKTLLCRFLVLCEYLSHWITLIPCTQCFLQNCWGGKALKQHLDHYTSPLKPLTNDIHSAALQSEWLTATHMCQDISSSSNGAEDLLWSKTSTTNVRIRSSVSYSQRVKVSL